MSSEAVTIFILFSVYQVKHFLADYLFQHNYMLKKIRPGWDFIWPLGLHCSVHAVMTLLIVICVRVELWWLALLDFLIHFLMDRFRSGPNYLGRFNDINKSIFWWILGMDQMIHHLTHIAIVWLLLYY
jgi:hypothetical protein